MKRTYYVCISSLSVSSLPDKVNEINVSWSVNSFRVVRSTMKNSVATLLILLACDNHARYLRYHRPQKLSLQPSGKFRISPTTGVRIALPSKSSCERVSIFSTESLAAEQLRWQAQELGVLIHFNMATYIDKDGCTDQIVPDISLFKPVLLNTDNWARTITDFGARYAVLVAKVDVDSLSLLLLSSVLR